MIALLVDPPYFRLHSNLHMIHTPEYCDILVTSLQIFSDLGIVIFKTKDKKEYRVLTKCFFGGGKITIDASQWFD